MSLHPSLLPPRPKALRILCANLTNRLEMLEEGDLPTDPPAHLTFEKACEVMKALVLAPQQEQVRVMKEGADDMDSFIVSTLPSLYFVRSVRGGCVLLPVPSRPVPSLLFLVMFSRFPCLLTLTLTLAVPFANFKLHPAAFVCW